MGTTPDPPDNDSGRFDLGGVGFGAATREWFATTFGRPTAAQVEAWPAVATGGHVLLCAPTGSGKTLAAFLTAIDRISHAPVVTDAKGRRVERTRAVRLTAASVGGRCREEPPGTHSGIGLAAERLGLTVPEPSVGVRTGDTTPQERRRLVAHPPDILITTPESLYLMLTSSARESLRAVDTVIVDEIHAMASSKRGSHLAVSLERLDCLTDAAPQRIGLSATQRPLSEVAHFLGGNRVADDGRVDGPRAVTIVDVAAVNHLDIEVVVPVEDMGALGRIVPDPGPGSPRTGADDRPSDGSGPQRRSIWPAIHPRLLQLVETHRSTIVFANAPPRGAACDSSQRTGGRRRGAGAENVGAPPAVGDLVRAHHGSLSREQRLLIEDELKSGTLKGLVATSSSSSASTWAQSIWSSRSSRPDRWRRAFSG
ncbi:MAG: DEAD/DEAH box helicase [Microthrixaceae bacterium]